MKRISLVKLGGLLMVAVGALVLEEAKALPYHPTPEGFAEYFSNVPWDSGSKYKFLNPRNCENEMTRCTVDYIEESPLGRRTCVYRKINFSTYSSKYELWDRPTKTDLDVELLGFSSPVFVPGECSEWEKVAETPEPQSEPAPPPQPQTSTTTSTTLNNNLILAGGAGILLLGGLLGVVGSRLLGRKRD